MDVIQLLKKDHKMVKSLFEEFEKLKGNAAQKKLDLVKQITQALTVHAQVEEELVYPTFTEHRSMKEGICEAFEEHHVTKMFLSELDAMQPGGERYDAKVKVLCEYLMHHVKEEEKEIFPEAQKRLSAKRLSALGEEVEARRSELMAGNEGNNKREKEDLRDEEMEEIEDMEQDNEYRQGDRGKGQRNRQHAA